MVGVAGKSKPAPGNIAAATLTQAITLSYTDFRNMLKGKGLLRETGKKKYSCYIVRKIYLPPFFVLALNGFKECRKLLARQKKIWKKSEKILVNLHAAIHCLSAECKRGVEIFTSYCKIYQLAVVSLRMRNPWTACNACFAIQRG